MRSMRLRVAFLVLSTGLTLACGSGQFNPNEVAVMISPQTAAVATNGQTTLQATIKHDCNGCLPLLTWTINENEGASCDWLDNVPPTGPCPAGTLQASGGAFPSGLTVTYIAPSTPGTFHVTAEWDYSPDLFGPPTITVLASSVITVTP